MSVKFETQQKNVSFGKKDDTNPKKIKNRSLLAAMAAMPILGNLTIYSNKFTNDLFLKSSNYNVQDITTLRGAVEKAFVSSGLKDKGCKIIKIVDKPFNSNAPSVDWLKSLNNAVKKNPENIEKLYKDVKLVNPENKRALAEYIKMFENSATRYEKFKFNLEAQFTGHYQELTQNLKPGTITNSPKMLKLIKRYMHAKDFSIFESGANAIAVPKHKLFFLPKNGLPATGFHEFGHMLNSAKTWDKVLRKSQYLRYVAPIVMLTAIFGKTKKETENKKLNPKEKTVNFIRNNAGKLMFFAQLPLLLDEGFASMTGQKLAKNLLKPELYKKVVKNNAFAFLTYFGIAAMTTFNAFAVVKVKDYFQNKYEAKIKAQKSN